jgi:uncharacterized protein YndB with AHSA1/START domain
MLIRRPVAEVFEAFIDPEITRKILAHQKQRTARSWKAGSGGERKGRVR